MADDQTTTLFYSQFDQIDDELLKQIDSFDTICSTKTDELLALIAENENVYKENVKHFNELMSVSQAKLTSLTNQHILQEKDSTKTEQKINKISSELNSLCYTKNVDLPNAIHENRANYNTKTEEVKQKRIKLQKLSEKHHKRMQLLLRECDAFEQYFGVRCFTSQNDSHLCIAFRYINKYDTAKEYYVTLAFVENALRITDIAPISNPKHEEIAKYLEDQINSQLINFREFVKLLRKYIVLCVQKQH